MQISSLPPPINPTLTPSVRTAPLRPSSVADGRWRASVPRCCRRDREDDGTDRVTTGVGHRDRLRPTPGNRRRAGRGLAGLGGSLTMPADAEVWAWPRLSSCTAPGPVGMPGGGCGHCYAPPATGLHSSPD